MIEHKSPISGIAAFGDTLVATAGYDNQVILWDAATQRSIARGLHDHLANQVRFSRCGRFLLSSSSDHSARLWSVPTMKVIQVFSGHDDDVEAVAFHPTEAYVATASRDAKARVFAFDGRLVATLVGHRADVISVEWTADGKGLITSSDDGTVKRWDVATQSLVQDIDLGGVETDTVVIAADGTIFAGNDEGAIIIIRDGHQSKVEAHRSGIKRLVYSGETGMLVSLSYDRKVRIWAVGAEGGITPIKSSELPIEIWPRSCAFLGTDKIAFATFGSSYATLHLSDLSWHVAGVRATPGVNAATALGGHVYAIGDAGIVWKDRQPLRTLPSLCNFLCPLGDYLLTGGQTGQIFDALSGALIHQHRSPLNCASAFTVNGQTFAVVGTYTGEGILLGIAATGQVVYLRDVQLHDNAIKGLASDDETLFSVCATGASARHDLATMAPLATLAEAHDKIANGCARLNDGRFASVSRDLKLRIWRRDSSVAVVTPHTFSIKCVAASDDGAVIASGDYGGTVAFYDLGLQRWLRVERPTSCGISSIAFDARRQTFLASSYDGTVYELSRPRAEDVA